MNCSTTQDSIIPPVCSQPQAGINGSQSSKVLMNEPPLGQCPPGPSVTTINTSGSSKNEPPLSQCPPGPSVPRTNTSTTPFVAPISSPPVATITIPCPENATNQISNLVPNDGDVKIVPEAEAVNLLANELENANKSKEGLEKENRDLKNRVNQLEVSLSTGMVIF